jgi:hypothetical protein
VWGVDDRGPHQRGHHMGSQAQKHEFTIRDEAPSEPIAVHLQ